MKGQPLKKEAIGGDDMKEVGIYICNYNKREYVVRCVESLLKQTFESQDIYVVDNASEDDSVEVLEKTFGRQISVIKNPENLGGSGGFNVGLRDALEKNYKYVVLVDNDVWVDSNTIEIMYHYMEKHTDVGILGPKILQMDKSDIVQDLGGSITSSYNMKGNYFGKKDIGLPDEIDCDYISTCTAMARIDAVKKFGIMPEENFIYWDDVEWSKKCQLEGYRTVALGRAKVWHKHSITGQASTFVKYYLIRNRLHYFTKYLSKQNMEHFKEAMLSEVFSQLYGYYNKGMMELFRATVYALDDFLHEIRGKADAFKIMRISEKPTPFGRILEGKSHIRITFMDNFLPEDPMDIYHIFLYIVANIQKQHFQKKLWVSLKRCSYKTVEFTEILKKVIEMDCQEFELPEILVSDDDEEEFDLNLRMCEHVKLVKENVLPEIYVDKYCNCITSEDDYMYFKGCSTNEKLFMEIYRPLMEQAIKRIRSKG